MRRGGSQPSSLAALPDRHFVTKLASMDQRLAPKIANVTAQQKELVITQAETNASIAALSTKFDSVSASIAGPHGSAQPLASSFARSSQVKSVA